MLKRLTSSLDDVYSAGGPIFAAVRDIVTATNAEQIIEALREHVLSEDIDRVSIIQIGFGPSGEPVTEAVAVSDNASVALDADLPESLRQHIGKQPVVVSSVAMLDRNAHELREYAQDVIQADSLAIFPLIGRDRTAGFLVLASRTPYAYSEREIQMLQTLAAQCAVVLENLSLLDAISRNSESLDLVNELARNLAGTHDLDAVGKLVASSLSRQRSLTHLSIALHEPGQLHARIHTFKGHDLPGTMEIANTCLEQSLGGRQVIYIPDVSVFPDGHLWHEADAISLVMAPLVIRDQRLGTLILGAAGIDRFSRNDVSLYGQVAAQVAAVLENTRLFERLEASLEETTMLYSTALAMNAARSLQEAHETTLNEVARLSGADRILLYLAGPDPRGKIEIIEAAGMWEDGAAKTETTRRYDVREAPVISQFLLARANLMFNTVHDDRRLSEAARQQLGEAGVNALMLIPLSTGNTWLGALLLEAHSGQIFSNEQARLCRNVADQAALVVDSQLLLRRTQGAAERERALRATASALSSTLDPESILALVLENLETVLPYDAANILIVDEGMARAIILRGYARRGVDENALMNLRIPVDTADNLRRMRDLRRPVIVSHTRMYADWVRTPETEWVESYAGAPIYAEDDLIGFLSLDSATPGFYVEDYADLLQAFAEQSAVAIQNSRLFHESQQRAKHEQAVSEIASQLQRAVSVDDVLETAARALQGMLGEYDVAVRLNTQSQDPSRQLLPESSEGDADEATR